MPGFVYCCGQVSTQGRVKLFTGTARSGPKSCESILKPLLTIQTSWYTVSAWRTLAEHVAESVRKGDPVVVHGRLRADVWEREGQPASVTHVVDATFVGHDLNRGTSTFLKAPRRERPDADTTALREALHELPTDTPQLDSEGREREAPAA